MTFTLQEISLRPDYVFFFQCGFKRVIVDEISGVDIECIKDQIFAEQFFNL